MPQGPDCPLPIDSLSPTAVIIKSGSERYVLLMQGTS
jgi:hypothetical protein